MTRTATQPVRSPRPRQPGTLGIPDLKIIGALRVLSYSSAKQLLRLLGYAPSSLTYVQSRLKRLADAGYLERLFMPRPSRAGSAPLLYRLTRKSIPILRAQGLDVPYRLRPGETAGYGYLHLQHTLTVNDVLIAATILARETPGQDQPRTRTPDEPDRGQRWRQTSAGRPRRLPRPALPGCPELFTPRGRSGQPWPGRLEEQGPRPARTDRRTLEQAFQTTSLTIMVLTTDGGARANQLLRWTAEVLDDLDRNELGELFVFAALDPATTPPAEMFLDPRWSSSGQDAPGPLLELAPAV